MVVVSIAIRAAVENASKRMICKQYMKRLRRAEMLVIASPIYYFGLTGQLQCVIHRTYAVGIPKKLKKSMLILSSGSEDVYEGAIYEYRQTFIDYMGLKDMGIYKAHGTKNRSKIFLAELKEAGEKAVRRK